MIPLLVDENFNADIMEGLRQREPSLDLLHVRDVGLAVLPIPRFWRGPHAQGRVLLTHDRRTIPAFAYDRVAVGLPMPGVFLVSDGMTNSQAIDELLLAVDCFTMDECNDTIRYFPL